MKTLLVCDKSGGHIFPALVFGEKIRQKGEVYFFAVSDSLKVYLKDKGFKVFGKILRSNNILVEGLWRFFEALALILKIKPGRIIGFGGKSSFFLVVLGRLFFIDTVIYEPNVKMGKANCAVSFFARRILRGFGLPSGDGKSVTVGIPLRENIKRIDKNEARKRLGLAGSPGAPVLFCFGGSQGSSFLNDMFSRLVMELKGDFQFIHLTGAKDYPRLKTVYEKINKKNFVKDFHYSMEELYSASDMVISRSGASTMAEIAYYRLPAIFIPYPGAGGHQKDNAFYFKKYGAAQVCLQDDFSFDGFKEIAEKMLFDDSCRKKISQALAGIKLGVDFKEFGCGQEWL